MVQTTRYDIYGDRTKIYDSEVKKLKECETSTKNILSIAKFHNFLFATSSSGLRVAKISAQLRKIALHLEKDFHEVTKDDLEKAVATFNRNHQWSEATKADYRRCIKQFFKWFEDEDPRLKGNDENQRKEATTLYKYVRTAIKITYPHKQVDYTEILTDEDIHAAIEKGCSSVKDRAFITVLHQTGCRAAEILNIRVKDIEFDGDVCTLFVDGKTGRRPVTIVKGLAELTRWLTVHPFKENQQGLLWIGESRNHRHEPLHHQGAQKIINRAFTKAGISKKHNLHWFRHSRASLLASHLTEQELCSYMGWVLGSREVRTYVHMSGRKIKDSILRMHGLQKHEEEHSVQRCDCGAVNDTQHKFCYKCGRPTSAAVHLQYKAAEQYALTKLVEILSDPDKKRLWEQTMENLSKQQS